MTLANMTKRIYFRAHGGTVQGVNFRNFTKKKADELKITGWVRNAPGEKVEGEAQGSDEALKKLMEEVDDGPTHAHVVKSEQKDIDVVEEEKEFVVRR